MANMITKILSFFGFEKTRPAQKVEFNLPFIKRSAHEREIDILNWEKSEIEKKMEDTSRMLERAQELRNEAQEMRDETQEELNKVIQLLRREEGKTISITTETSTRRYTKNIPVGMAMGGGFIAHEEWEVKETTTSILAGDVVIHKTTSTSERMVSSR